MNRSLVLRLAISALLFGTVVFARAERRAEANYHLYPRDQVRVSVFGEPDMTVEQRIDGDGVVTLPLLGPVTMRGLTVSEAENQIKNLYLSRQYFVHPQVSVAVTEYSPKEVSVVGQVKNPGAVPFPMEADSWPVVNVISRVGGFTRIGRADSVRVTRTDPDGTRHTFIVNVKGMLDGRESVAPFMVQPGDVIFVPETIF